MNLMASSIEDLAFTGGTGNQTRIAGDGCDD